MFLPALCSSSNEPGTMSIGFTVATESFFLYFSRSKIQIFVPVCFEDQPVCAAIFCKKELSLSSCSFRATLTSSASILHSKPYRPAMVSAMRLMLVFFQTCSLFFHESSSRLAGDRSNRQNIRAGRKAQIINYQRSTIQNGSIPLHDPVCRAEVGCSTAPCLASTNRSTCDPSRLP